MNKLIPTSLAALIAAALLGCGSTSSTGGETSSDPSPTEPSVRRPHVIHANADGYFGVTVTIALPSWRGQPDEGRLIWNDDIDPPVGAGMIVWAGSNDDFYVYGNPCHWSSTKPDTPVATVDEFVDALEDQALRVPSEPEEITVDGYVGKRIVLGMADDVDFDACDEGHFVLFGQAGDNLARYSQGPSQIEEVWAVDVDGRIVIHSGFYFPDTPQHAIEELRAIFASATYQLT